MAENVSALAGERWATGASCGGGLLHWVEFADGGVGSGGDRRAVACRRRVAHEAAPLGRWMLSEARKQSCNAEIAEFKQVFAEK
jgi:hypothetical protein